MVEWISNNLWVLLLIPVILTQVLKYFPKLADLLPKKADGSPDENILIDVLNAILKAKKLPLISAPVDAPADVLSDLKVKLDAAIADKTLSLQEKLKRLLEGK